MPSCWHTGRARNRNGRGADGEELAHGPEAGYGSVVGGDSSWLHHLLSPHACGTLRLMGAIVYRVHADWDPDAKVWVATSDDVPGLATEAQTVEALAEKLRIMIAELLEANQLLSGDQPDAIAFELT